MALVTLTLSAVSGRGGARASVAKVTRSFSATASVWALRVSRYNPNSGVVEDFHYSTKNLFTAWGGPASTYFTSILVQPVLASRTGFDDHTTQGRGRVSVGQAVLKNLFGALDYLQSYPVDGRSITAYLGQENADFPSGFQVVFDGTMEQELIGQDTSVLKIRDWQRAAKVPIQTTVYAGDNVAPDGLEGEADLKGKPKPVLMGSVRNATPVLVNADKQIYQVHDGAIEELSAVYDSGVVLGEPTKWVQTEPAATFTSGNPHHLCYSADLDLYVAIAVTTPGVVADLATSSDATTWTLRTSAISAGLSLQDVDFGGPTGDRRFVMVALGGEIQTSPDGVTWTARTSGTANGLLTVRWYETGQLWVAAGVAGTLLTSPTGTTWTSRTSSFGASSIKCLAAGPTYIVAGSGDSSLVGKVAYSADGITWTQSFSSVAANFPQDWNRALYANGEYRMVGTAGLIIRSVDGVTWNRMSSAFDGTAGGATYTLYAIAYGNGVWLVGGSTTDYAVAADDLWTRRAVNLAGTGILSAVFGRARFVAASLAAGINATLHGETYASLADLEDDTLAPTAGNWKVYLAGGYFRLGSMPFGRVTCDPVQDSSFTPADGWAAALVRAGYASGTDYSATDVSTRSAANPAPTGDYITDGDKVMCADKADDFARTDGSMWFGDANGVLRLIALEDPIENVVTSPDTLTAAAGWTVAGTAVTTALYSTLGSIGLTRVQNANGVASQIARSVTLTGNGTKRFQCIVEYDSATGTTQHGLFDDTAGAYIARATVTWNSDGTATAVAVNGTLVRFTLIRANCYGLVMTATAVAAHTHTVYPHAAATAASVRIGRVTVTDAIPDFTLSSMDGTSGEIVDLYPVPSADVNSGLPVNRSVVRYSKNFTPMYGADIAGGVSDDDRVLFGKEFLDAATDLDSAVIAAHPLSVQRVDDSLYTEESGAQDAADLRQSLFGVERYWFDCVVLLTDTTAQIEVGDVVEIVSGRFLTGAGVRFRVLGIKPDAQSGRITLQLFR